MYYVYVLQCNEDHSLYIGYTSDLRRRLKSHFAGKTRSLKSKKNLTLVYYEAYRNKHDATKREWTLKHNGQQREQLKERIKHSLITPPSSSG